MKHGQYRQIKRMLRLDLVMDKDYTRIASIFVFPIVVSLTCICTWLDDKMLAEKQWGKTKSLIGWKNISWHAIISCQPVVCIRKMTEKSSFLCESSLFNIHQTFWVVLTVNVHTKLQYSFIKTYFYYIRTVLKYDSPGSVTPRPTLLNNLTRWTQ